MVYWVASLQNGIKRRTGRGYSGGVTVLLLIVTFGLYYPFWLRQMGAFFDEFGAEDKDVVPFYSKFFAEGKDRLSYTYYFLY